MPGVSIQLCCWHAKRAWLRNLLEKVKDADKRTAMFKALDKLMRLNVACPTTWTAEQLEELCQQELAAFFAEYRDEAAFVAYFKAEWATTIGEGPLLWIIILVLRDAVPSSLHRARLLEH